MIELLLNLYVVVVHKYLYLLISHFVWSGLARRGYPSHLHDASRLAHGQRVEHQERSRRKRHGLRVLM